MIFYFKKPDTIVVGLSLSLFPKKSNIDYTTWIALLLELLLVKTYLFFSANGSNKP